MGQGLAITLRPIGYPLLEVHEHAHHYWGVRCLDA